MPPALSKFNVFSYFVPTKVALSFRLHKHWHHRVTVRHILLTLGISTILSTLYYTHRARDSFSQDTTRKFEEPVTPQIWAERAAQVKEAFRHAYHGYENYSFTKDELLPLSNMTVNNFNGWGVTIVDSLDTMLLMGLEDEFTRALPVISNTNFSLPTNEHVPFFEAAIRYLGGLLSAYALSGNDLLRQKADELGSKLAVVFHTKSGLPAYAADTYKGTNPMEGSGVLAEIASFQMEYAYLGKITGKKEHVDHATRVTDVLYTANLSETGGMYPTRWSLRQGTPIGNFLSVGGLADSGHEYTLKQFLMTARTDRRNLEMYLRFTSYVINNLLFLSPNRHLLYVTDGTKGDRWFSASHTFEHLSCFFPGLLALGVHLLPLNDLDALGINIAALADDLLPADRRAYAHLSEFNLLDLHLWAAEGIAETCYTTYADQPTGLGPEIVWMDVDQEIGEIRWMNEMREWNARNKDGGDWSGLGNLWGRRREQRRLPPGVGDMEPWTSPLNKNSTLEIPEQTERSTVKQPPLAPIERDYMIKNAAYYLRPETIESMYILWRTTGDVKWRHRGWEMFQAIERYTKTPSGYASIENVTTPYPIQQDSMPSYFLAETLKYLYLMFLDEDPLPLDKWVFNTEAHPLPVFEWTMEEKKAYGIIT